jgi:enoyl-CoA hydratase/carnithine racemase
MSQREIAGHLERELPPRSSRPPSMRPEREVRVEDDGAIRDVILDRRSKKNAITLGMYVALGDAVSEAAANNATSVLLIRSSGGAFTVGNDVVTGAEADPAALEAFSQAESTFLKTLADFPKPIVAAVNGLAVGIGAMMLLYCDLVIASEFAAFEFSSARQGTMPHPLSCALLEARIGLQRASEWLLLGERIKADEVLRLGLINAIVPLENLHTSARTRAETLSRLPRRAALETKRLLHEPMRIGG